MDTTTLTPTSKRDEVIDYLMFNYTEIFELSSENKEKTRANIEQMNESELLYELELIGRFYEKEKEIYQNAYRQFVQAEEQSDKQNEAIPTLNF